MDTYHPNFFNQDESTAIRKDCQKRLDIIRKYVKKGSILFDIGCSGGFYSFGLSDICWAISAIDNDKRLIDYCNKIKEEHKINNVLFCGEDINNMDRDVGVVDINPDGDWYIKNFDMTLYMSVHHHVIRHRGMIVANMILLNLSNHTDKMIFDMGQKDEELSRELMSRDVWWNYLPETDNPAEWTKQYLLKNTSFTKATEIGKTKIHKTERVLWLLEK